VTGEVGIRSHIVDSCGIVVRSQTQRSWLLLGSSPTRNAAVHVIHTHGAQANSVPHPSGVGKSVAVSTW